MRLRPPPLILALWIATSALAQPSQGRPPHGPPPPEALAACKSLTAGKPCSFNLPNGNKLSGSCFTPGADRPLACKPDGAPTPEGAPKAPR